MSISSIKKQTGSAQLSVAILMMAIISAALYFGWLLKQETESAAIGTSGVAELSRTLSRLEGLSPQPNKKSLDDANSVLAMATTDMNSFGANVKPALGQGVNALDRFYSSFESEKLILQQNIHDLNQSLVNVREFNESKKPIEAVLGDFVKANDTFATAMLSLNNIPRSEVLSLNTAVRSIELAITLSLSTNGTKGDIDEAWDQYSRVIRDINSKVSTGIIAKKSTISRGLSLAAQTANSLRSYFDTIKGSRESVNMMTLKAEDLNKIAGELSEKSSAYFQSTRGVFGYKVNIQLIGFLMIAAIALALVTVWMANTKAKGISDSMTYRAKTASEGSALKSRSVQNIVNAINLIKQGDLTVRLEETDEFTRDIAEAVNSLVANFCEIISEVKVMSSELHAASAQSAQTANNVEESREQQDHAITNAYQMTRDLHSAIEAIEQSAKKTASCVEDSIRSVQAGSKAIEETNQTVKEISTVNQTTLNRLKSMMDSVQGLNTVVEMITDVSSQTRMLSLNLPLLVQDVDEHTAKRINYAATKMNEFVDSTTDSLKRIDTVVSSVVGEASEMQKSVEGSTTMASDLLAQSGRAKEAIISIEAVAVKVEENSGLVETNTRKVAESSQDMVASMESVKQYNQDSSQASKETAAAIGNVAKNTVKIVNRVEGFKVG